LSGCRCLLACLQNHRIAPETLSTSLVPIEQQVTRSDTRLALRQVQEPKTRLPRRLPGLIRPASILRADDERVPTGQKVARWNTRLGLPQTQQPRSQPPRRLVEAYLSIPGETMVHVGSAKLKSSQETCTRGRWTLRRI
jgi:hypothetical protein